MQLAQDDLETYLEMVRKSRNRLVKKYHPDILGNGQNVEKANERIRKINVAYSVLTDRVSRERYHAQLDNGHYVYSSETPVDVDEDLVADLIKKLGLDTNIFFDSTDNFTKTMEAKFAESDKTEVKRGMSRRQLFRNELSSNRQRPNLGNGKLNRLMKKVQNGNQEALAKVIGIINFDNENGLKTLNLLIELGCLDSDNNLNASRISEKIAEGSSSAGFYPRGSTYGLASLKLIQNGYVDPSTSTDIGSELNNRDKVFLNICAGLDIKSMSCEMIIENLAKRDCYNRPEAVEVIRSWVKDAGINQGSKDQQVEIPKGIQILQKYGHVSDTFEVIGATQRTTEQRVGF